MSAQTRNQGCPSVRVRGCVFHRGDGVEGMCPWARSPSSPHKGPACSPWWHLTQCLSSSPVSRALCPAIRPVNTHTHTHAFTVAGLGSNGLRRVRSRTRAHGSDTPGKADLPLRLSAGRKKKNKNVMPAASRVPGPPARLTGAPTLASPPA